MAVSVLRFILNGWIEQFYIQPEFHFKYFGFHWVTDPGVTGLYILFSLMVVSSLLVMIGYKYRIAAITFFLTFTYVELIDITYYLNHYYFVSVVSFIMIFLPADRYFAIDTKKKGAISSIPKWMILFLQLQLFIVYFYAGLAKLNYDWLVNAMPLKIWLPAHSDLPVIGSLMTKEITAYIFSWFGALYDLTIPFLLFYRKTRWIAYFFVVVFHLMTALLFQIGMFPYVMILLTLVFFREDLHEKWLNKFRNIFKTNYSKNTHSYRPVININFIVAIVTFVMLELFIPFRYLLYPGNLFWSEEGYRFSWRVMLMEKAGTSFFYVTDSRTGKTIEVNNSKYLTRDQEKQMSTQPDLILQFAHFIEKEYSIMGFENPEVRTETYVTLNGRRSKLLINPKVDLTKIEDSFAHKDWILDYED